MTGNRDLDPRVLARIEKQGVDHVLDLGGYGHATGEQIAAALLAKFRLRPLTEGEQ